MKSIKNWFSLLALTVLLISSSTALEAIPENYIEGAVLRVNAKSGLKLREEPSLNARVFTTMDFGEEVTVLNTLGFQRTQTIELVQGNWVYVEYRGFKGFAFDGFLTDLPLPTSNFDLLELIELTADVVTDSVAIGDHGQEKTVKIYENGIEVNNIDGEGGVFIEVVLPDTRLSEAYVLCMNTIPDFEEMMKTMRVKRDDERNIVAYKSQYDYKEVQIKAVGGKVVVRMYAGC